MKPIAIALLSLAALAPAGPAALAENARQDRAVSTEADPAQPLKDAFLKGRILGEMTAEPDVAAFDLEVKVENGVAYLDGAVESEVQRDLAIEIAKGVEDVRDVRSAITVKADARAEAQRERRSLGQTLDDAGTTAAIKTELLANRSTAGTGIDVDTRKGIVTLRGKVKSEAEKKLAERIAENSSDALEVKNELVVSSR